MGQSLVSNLLHIIFSTKLRQPLIQPSIEQDLHAYLGGICNKLDCAPIKIGGHIEHVHMLVSLSKKVSLVTLMEDVKSNSSKWIKTKGASFHNFYWQDGYGAFSVNPLQIEAVVAYINNQHDHHKKITFQQEYLGFLKKAFFLEKMMTEFFLN